MHQLFVDNRLLVKIQNLNLAPLFAIEMDAYIIADVRRTHSQSHVSFVLAQY
jgi:hypothetical protein